MIKVILAKGVKNVRTTVGDRLMVITENTKRIEFTEKEWESLTKSQKELFVVIPAEIAKKTPPPQMESMGMSASKEPVKTTPVKKKTKE